MKTTKEFLGLLEETVNYYKSDPEARRAVDDKGRCNYLNKEGSKCAVGRCLTDESLDKIVEDKLTSSSVTQLDYEYKNEGGIESLLKDQYRGFPIAFWIDLQKIHDREMFWTSKELTSRGRVAVEKVTGLIEKGAYNVDQDFEPTFYDTYYDDVSYMEKCLAGEDVD